ncbi:uncharacterized protein dyl [Planococcus citri]|uniref:uncharacterized protein dyl n=1 Tax=Planococcus citri TaxID=170843 RepID=UPI0031FA10D9
MMSKRRHILTPTLAPASALCRVLLLLASCCWLQKVVGDAPHLESAALPLEHRAVYGAALPGPPAPQYGAPGPDDPWPLAASDTPEIKHLQVQCEKTHMRVNIEFDRPFYGMIFSKGYYSDHRCVHLKPGSGHLSATFEIFLNSCGMSSSGSHNAAANAYPTPSGSFVENTIIIQYDPYVQESSDKARKLRCTWYDFYEKAVTFRPFQVDMLSAVTANFLGDNLQCWMQIQVGKGPWASEVSGIVKIGQTMTMVLAIKDDENKFDMLVRNCVAHDGKRAPIQLVDQHGCVVRPKIMSRFQKVKNFGPSASVVSFAYFQAFKFPDSMNVHFQCVIQVCRYNCPEPKCAGGGLGLLGGLGGAEYGGIGGGGGALDIGDYNRLPGGVGGGGAPHDEYALPPQPGFPEYPGLLGGLGGVGGGGGGAAFPDPRHPSGPAGAYSEQKAEIVPAPGGVGVGVASNFTNPSSPSPQKTSPSGVNTNGNDPANTNNNNNNNNNNINDDIAIQNGVIGASSGGGGGGGNGNGNSNNNNNVINGVGIGVGVNGHGGNGNGININSIDDDFNLPPPPLPGQSASYTTVKRKGTISDEDGNLITLGGRPRSVENLSEDLGLHHHSSSGSGIRKRRSYAVTVGTGTGSGSGIGAATRTFVVTHVYKREAQEMTDVNTSRVIQVVAPGDVNFALNAGSGAANETVVVSSQPASAYEKDSICISVASFVAGLVMLLSVLVVACLVAAFLFVRVRTFDTKNAQAAGATTFVHTFDAADFVKVAS